MFNPKKLLTFVYYSGFKFYKILTKMDPSSFSSCDVISTKHVDINWLIDFDKTKLVGNVKLHLDILQDCTEKIVSFFLVLRKFKFK